MLDFDEIDDWAPTLTVALAPHLPDGIESILTEAAPEFIEDALDQIFCVADRDQIIDATLAWIRSTQLIGYHGTRLNDEEVASIRRLGLLPLKASSRRYRLERALSRHPNWDNVAQDLDAAISAHGEGEKMGQREDQVHVTMSRAGLVRSFNEYLKYGSEFDQRVAHALLGPAGVELLALDGQARLVKVAVPGDEALKAAHLIYTIEDIRRMGDLPNIVDHFLRVWSYRLAYPGFQVRPEKIDCGMVFGSVVPHDWILKIETLSLAPPGIG